ncbi:hypothetical protein FRX31_021685 [Thalictrum thalictroides]|uniref:DUF4283 domain-containing protein n=1 Tax=Thalictrum thalictroides TaxID=46969 RepID=A0A7J6VX02_THATH|nr:hypothetical protein FRX31_021685 [Thalictrum thalictroides]
MGKGTIEVGVVFKFFDGNQSVVVTVSQNRRGVFLQVMLVNRNGGKKNRILCIPIGAGCNGYASLGANLRPMMENRNIGRQEVPTTQDFPQMQRIHNRPNTFVEARGRSNVVDQRGNRVTVETQDRLQGVFGYAELKETSIGEALVFLDTEDMVQHLITLPPLRVWGNCFTFTKWEPWMGALKIDKSTKMDVLIAFSGLPYHLRACQVVEALAKKCGNQIEVDIMHLKYYETHCFAKIKNCEIHMVPRIIPVEEKGKVYYVWVEIVDDRLRSLARRPEPETIVVQNKSPVNIPSCGIRDECVQVDQLDINLDVGPN